MPLARAASLIVNATLLSVVVKYLQFALTAPGEIAVQNYVQCFPLSLPMVSESFSSTPPPSDRGLVPSLPCFGAFHHQLARRQVLMRCPVCASRLTFLYELRHAA